MLSFIRILNFKEKFYAPSNAVFVVAGDIDVDETKQLISEYFDEVPYKGEKPEKNYPVEEPLKEEIRVKEYDPNIQIPALFYAFRTPAMSNRDSAVINYIAQHLSGSESSILYKKLVDEKQMALGVQSFNIEQEDYSLFTIFILPQGETTLDDLILEVEVEIEKIQKELISESNYMKVQNAFENSYVSSLSSVTGRSQSLARYYHLYGDASMINKFPEIYSLYKEKSFEFNSIKQLNRNKLLWRDDSSDGVKTGHTESAGYCLVGSAKRGGMRLITVVAGSSSDKKRFDDTQRLLEYGFRFFSTQEVLKKDQVYKTVKVWGGQKSEAGLGVTANQILTLPRVDFKDLQINYIYKNNIQAPIKKGDVIGSIEIISNDSPVLVTDLVALDEVEAKGFFGRLWSKFILWIMSLFGG